MRSDTESGQLPATVRYLAMLWSGLLMLSVGFGWFNNEKIGAVPWGPTNDIRSMAIAISDIEFNLKGGIGYRAVMQKLADIMTAKKSDIDVNDDATRLLVGNPAVVTRAIQAAATLKRETLKPEYVHELAEDIGYAYYYKFAFQIFGYSAYSTYFLYLAIWGLSSAIFVIAYHRDNISIGVLTLSNSTIFLLTSCPPLFSAGMPSLGSGRFLWTLAIVPSVHLMLAILTTKKLARVDLFAILCQILLAAVAIGARLTGQWCIMAVVLTGIYVIFANCHQHLRELAKCGHFAAKNFARAFSSKSLIDCAVAIRQSVLSLALLPRALPVTAIVVAATMLTGTIEKANLDQSYFTDDNLPHHFIWHSAYIALTIHPDWSNRKSYADLPDHLSDAVAFGSFEHFMKDKGLPYISLEGVHKLRLHDKVIRQLFIEFALRNPQYMFELYAWYKPRLLYGTIVTMIRETLSPIGLLVYALTIGLCAVLFAGGRRGYFVRGSIVGVPLLFACSMIPGMWAYPVVDQAWSSLFVGQMLMIAVARQRRTP